MKSFFIFLSRNKGYTLINFFGLSVSLMFVMLIGLYTWQEKSIDRQVAHADRIEALCMSFNGTNECEGIHHYVGTQLRRHYPEIESACGVCQNNSWVSCGGDYLSASLLSVDTTFFHVFDYKLLEGDRNTCLTADNSAVLTESFARKLFGSADPMGQTVTIDDTIRFRVTGIMQDLDNTVFCHTDMLTNFSRAKLYNMANTDEAFVKGAINFTGSSVFLLMRPGHSFIGRSRELTKFISTFWPNFNGSWKCEVFTTPFSHLYLSNIDQGNDVTRRGNPTLINILMVATLLILLFAVTNYINLTVALSGRRAREMATRQLFGATRSRVFARLVA